MNDALSYEKRGLPPVFYRFSNFAAEVGEAINRAVTVHRAFGVDAD